MKSWLMVFFTLVFSVNVYAINYPITPEEILKQAEKRTWPVVNNEIFTDQTAANMVLLAIDSGQKDWLELAVTILQNTDNPRTQKMLIMSLGEALQWQPEAVFDIAVKQVDVKHLCSLEGIYEWRLMSQFLAMQAINRRINRLNMTNSFKYFKAKKQCLGQLALSKIEVSKQLTNKP